MNTTKRKNLVAETRELSRVSKCCRTTQQVQTHFLIQTRFPFQYLDSFTDSPFLSINQLILITVHRVLPAFHPLPGLGRINSQARSSCLSTRPSHSAQFMTSPKPDPPGLIQNLLFLCPFLFVTPFGTSHSSFYNPTDDVLLVCIRIPYTTTTSDNSLIPLMTSRNQ